MLAAALTSNNRISLLTAVFGLGMIFYLAIEPTPVWLLLPLAALVAVGAHALIRNHPSLRSLDPADTVFFLVLPTLAVIATGVSLEEAVDGYASAPIAIVITPPFAILLYSLYASFDPSHPAYPFARVTLTITAYLIAFALYALSYSLDLNVAGSAFVIGLSTTLLAPEILRESESSLFRLSIYGALLGLVLAQTRWILNFTPLDGHLAAAFLLAGFYCLAGLLQHHFAGSLTPRAAGEFLATGVTAIFIITIAQAVS